MKTFDSIPNVIPGLACLLVAMAALSCQSTSSPIKTKRVSVSMNETSWVKVSSHPPTYYPRGVAADCPTDHWSGEWVYTGDESGTRYFIPLHGLGNKREMLVLEALMSRSDRKLDQISAEDQDIHSRNVRNMVVAGPPLVTGMLLLAMVGTPPPSGEDIQRLQKEWCSSKQPH